MKAYVALTIATEIDGRATVVRADKASSSREKLEEWMKSRHSSWREQIKLGPPPQQQGFNAGLQPQQTIIDCVCQTQVIEVEVEDN